MQLANLIDEAVEKNYKDAPRDYIGASSIGNPCSRAIWYAYKDVKGKPITARQIRTFETGKKLEEMIKAQLELVLSFNPHQIGAWKDIDYPVFQGTPDCVALLDDVYVIIEIKTAKDSSYATFFKKGLREWNMQYYAQLQAYMGLSDGKITSSYILVLNKNTGDIHDERIEFDEIFYHELKEKAKFVSEAQQAPERINKNPMFYLCSMCKFKEICHG